MFFKPLWMRLQATSQARQDMHLLTSTKTGI
jgi:hypothetical protein